MSMKLLCITIAVIGLCEVSGMLNKEFLDSDIKKTDDIPVGPAVMEKFKETVMKSLIPGMNESFGTVMKALSEYPEGVTGLQPIIEHRTKLATDILSIMQEKIKSRNINEKLDVLSKACLVCYSLGCSSKQAGDKLLKEKVWPMVLHYLQHDSIEKEKKGSLDVRIAKCYRNACEIIKTDPSLSDIRSGIWLYLFLNNAVTTREPN